MYSSSTDIPHRNRWRMSISKKSKENKEELLLGDKRLSEVVDYNLHIAPYKLIQIMGKKTRKGDNYYPRHIKGDFNDAR